MPKTPLFEQDVPLSLETLKAYFQQNDFSSQISGYDIDKADANESRVYVKVRKQFRAAWEKQLKTLANRSSMRNFSSAAPIVCLERAEEKLITGSVMEILSTDGLAEKIISSVIDNSETEIINECEKYAEENNKTVDDLDDNDMEVIVDRFSDVFLGKIMNIFMQTQSVPEIMSAQLKNGTPEDFNYNINKNFDRTNFERKRNAFESKVGTVLSLERLEADGFQFVAADVFDTVSEQLLESLYLERLDEVQKEIYYLRMNGFTQKEIAERLGYKTHSAVTKQMQKMREKFTELKKYLEG